MSESGLPTEGAVYDAAMEALERGQSAIAMHPDDMLQLARESGVFDMGSPVRVCGVVAVIPDPSVPRGTIQPRER